MLKLYHPTPSLRLLSTALTEPMQVPWLDLSFNLLLTSNYPLLSRRKLMGNYSIQQQQRTLPWIALLGL